MIQIKASYRGGLQLDFWNAFSGDLSEMYQNTEMLAAFLLIYSAIAGRVERAGGGRPVTTR
jgi:hypothetical protein